MECWKDEYPKITDNRMMYHFRHFPALNRTTCFSTKALVDFLFKSSFLLFFLHIQIDFIKYRQQKKKYPISFLQERLSGCSWHSNCISKRLFCLIRNTTHNDNVKSRVSAWEQHREWHSLERHWNKFSAASTFLSISYASVLDSCITGVHSYRHLVCYHTDPCR